MPFAVAIVAVLKPRAMRIFAGTPISPAEAPRRALAAKSAEKPPTAAIVHTNHWNFEELSRPSWPWMTDSTLPASDLSGCERAMKSSARTMTPMPARPMISDQTRVRIPSLPHVEPEAARLFRTARPFPASRPYQGRTVGPARRRVGAGHRHTVASPLVDE